MNVWPVTLLPQETLPESVMLAAAASSTVFASSPSKGALQNVKNHQACTSWPLKQHAHLSNSIGAICRTCAQAINKASTATAMQRGCLQT